MHVTELGLQLISDATTIADETYITSSDYATNLNTNPNSHITLGKVDKHHTDACVCLPNHTMYTYLIIHACLLHAHNTLRLMSMVNRGVVITIKDIECV